MEKFTRKQLESYMIDCHSFDIEQVNEWETKADLAADIKSFGWESDCIEYLS